MPKELLITKLKEGETVMVCRHIYERSACKVVLRLSDMSYTEYTPARQFTRDDDTTGRARFYVKCDACRYGARPGEVDYVETFYKDERFHVTDFSKERA